MLEVLKVSRKNTGGCIGHIWRLLLTVGRGVVDEQSCGGSGDCMKEKRERGVR